MYMSDYKEFLGKTLDAAIGEACAYFNAPREKLEIDILEDAKSGIFGLVGARKARIRARMAHLPDMEFPSSRRRGKGRSHRDDSDPEKVAAMSDDNPVESEDCPASAGEQGQGDSSGSDRTALQGKQKRDEQDAAPSFESQLEASRDEESADKKNKVASNDPDRYTEEGKSLSAETETDQNNENGEDDEDEDAQAAILAGQTQGFRGRGRRPLRQPGRTRRPSPRDSQEASVPRVSLAELDQAKLLEVSTSIIRTLVTPIVGEEEALDMDVSLANERVQVRIQCADTGLLIGRDGQNLAAIQYLAARMIGRAMDAQIRIQVDAGDYHFRQDSRLQEMALALADRARETGKPQVTRLLSAYQRRVIHLTLQDIADVQTHSSGEGSLKRVVIQPVREQVS